MPHIMERELIENRFDWVCSQCECPFFNPDWVIAAATLMAIVEHFKKMREQAFANHICFGTPETHTPFVLSRPHVNDLR
jgi:hypothetical protein